jgi:ankyrin repeat protein
LAHADVGSLVRFLLAQLHLDSLAKKLTRREVRTALGSLPKELDEVYDQAMQRIKNQDENQAALAHKVLYWISCSLRPLTLAEMQHALAVEPGDEDLDKDGIHDKELMISVCAGLVTVDEESNQIRLVHYTTQSYIERIRMLQFPEAPSTMAKTCLTYLAFNPFTNNYSRSEEEHRIRLDKYPFLGYAANYWGDHTRHGTDDDVHGLTLKFLSNPVGMLNAIQAVDRARSDLAWYSYGSRVPNLTRLHIVVSFGLVDIAQNLLAEGADVDARTDRGITPLHLAAKAGRTQMVHLLLQAGAKVSRDYSAPETPIDRKTPLHMAAKAGHTPVVQLLIDAGADCNEPTVPTVGYEKSPLHLAAVRGHIDVARVLLSKGANVNQKDAYVDRLPGSNKDQIRGKTPLNGAVEQGHEALVRLLLDNGADISATHEAGRTALHQSACAGHVNLVGLLIRRGIDVSTKDTFGRTALHYAANKGQADIVRILLEHNADVLAEDTIGNTAVHEAARLECESVLRILLERIGKGNETERWIATPRLRRAVEQADEDEVRFSLRKGADPNAVTKGGNSLLHNGDIPFADDIPCLHIAVVRENAKVLQLLLANGASVNRKESRGGTALHWAAKRGYNAGIQVLLNHHANIQAEDMEGVTPLHIATGFSSASVVKLLIDNGARLDAKAKDGRTPLSWSLHPGLYLSFSLMHNYPMITMREDEEQKKQRREEEEQDAKDRLAVLDLLIERGADLKEQQPDGYNTLHLAIKPSRETVGVALISRLLEKGVDVAAQTSGDRSALYMATLCRLPEVVRLLVEHGADVNQKNKQGLHAGPHVHGETALHVAARNGLVETARLLIKGGADVKAVNENGFTALHYAAQKEEVETARLLIEAGADKETVRGYGVTALHVAAMSGAVAIARLLIKAGADVNAVSDDGATALQDALARMNGSVEMARLLIEAGADVKTVKEDGVTALHNAATHPGESTAIVDLLLIQGADINARYGDKMATVLHHIAFQGNIAMAQLLLEQGARITATDVDGRTALDWAKDTGHEAMIFVLSRHDMSAQFGSD